MALTESLEPYLVVVPCYTGNGEPSALGALRSAPGLVNDGLRVHSFVGQQHLFNPPYSADRNYWKSSFVRDLLKERPPRPTGKGRRLS